MIKLERCFKKVITYEKERYSVDGNKNISIYVSSQNGKVVDYHIVSKIPPFGKCQEGKNPKNFIYYYFDKKIFSKFKTNRFADIDFNNFIIPFEKFKNDKKIDLDRMLCPYYDGHLVFRIKDLYPIPTIMHFDYLDGIDNEYYCIDKALVYLKKNRFVLKIKKEEIPYYNREEHRTHGLTMKVLFSNAMFKKMWDCVKKDQFPSVKMSQLVCCHYIKEDIDPLGIKKFIKPENKD